MFKVVSSIQLINWWTPVCPRLYMCDAANEILNKSLQLLFLKLVSCLPRYLRYRVERKVYRSSDVVYKHIQPNCIWGSDHSNSL